MISAFLILILCFAIIIALYQWKLKSNEIVNFLSRFPGPRKFPIIGNLWFLSNSEERLSKMMDLQRNYGNRVHLAGGHLGGLLLFHPDDVEKILTSKDLNKSRLYDLIFTDWLGSTLFYSKGGDHFKKRKLILPAFDVQRVDNFERTLNENSKTLRKILKINSSKGIPTEIQELFRLCTLDMAWQYVGGVRTKSLESNDHEYATAVHSETEFLTYRAASPWLWPKILWKMSTTGRNEEKTRRVLHSFMENVVEERKSKLNNNNYSCLKKRESEIAERGKLKLLDLLVTKQQEEGSDVTNEYIRDETNNILLAAHHTIASALTFFLYLLASHPDQQAKLHKELDRVFGEDKERDIELSDLRQLKFLECCFKETLRLYPPVPILLRSVEEDFQLDKNLMIPKGVEIGLAPWVTHRLPEFFPEPEKFIPSRFFPENSTRRHQHCYFPFSGGPRSCMGQKAAMMKAKTILASIFRSFIVELDPRSEKVNTDGGMIIFAKDGLKIHVIAR